ncbi:MAG: hypothetical protein HYS18_17305 [Burkholderiales bacterium]|nr:hypothetical protein [Burkholderiales bacterium]
MKSFRSSCLAILRLEKGMLRRYPKLRLAAFGSLFIPALYTLIYLSSVWDPNSKTSALPVGIVNQDAGIRYRDQVVNVGNELIRELEKKEAFGYRYFTDPEVARRRVRTGDLAFALIIPPAFSEHAVPGSESGAAKLIIYTSEGNDYTSAGFAKRFAPEIAHRVNEALNEKRWELVLTSAGSSQSLARLKEGVAQLRSGAGELHHGLSNASKGAADLAQGSAQTYEGSKRLESGAKELSTNVVQLGTGIK